MDTLKVPMNLVGVDGNAFVILGTFRKKALRAGYTKEQTEAVITHATSGDYDHLLQTIIFNTVDVDDED